MNGQQKSTHDPMYAIDPITFGRVMIAVDKSDTSDWALGVGSELAARLGEGVVVALVHVVDLSKGFTPELGILDERKVDELRASGEGLLRRCEQKLPAGRAVSRILREGDPASEIVSAADEWRADVIVLGAHARGPVARFLLGSTAEAVVRRAHCPVLTVGHRPKGARGASEVAAEQPLAPAPHI